MTHSDDLKQLESDLFDLSAGTADPKTVDRVNSLLRESAELRLHAARYLIDDSLLQQSSQSKVATEVFRNAQLFPSANLSDSRQGLPRSGDSQKRFRKAPAVVALAAMAASLFLAATLLRRTTPQESTSRAVAENNSTTPPEEVDTNPFEFDNRFAVLTESFNTKWVSQKLNPGSSIGDESIKISAGLLQLEFFCGATIVVEGPAELKIRSPLRVEVSQGKTRVYAPEQAYGFTVAAPGMDVVDLGTEFAVQVEEGGQSAVHVLDGEVALRSTGPGADAAESIQLARGRTAKLASHELREIVLSDSPTQIEDLFFDTQALSAVASAIRNSRYQIWQQHSNVLRNDPQSLLYCDFPVSEQWSRTLPVTSALTSKSLNGAIVGAEWSTGRWPTKSALDFKGTSDRVRLSIPGEYDSLSFLAWVRVDEILQKRNSILLTDGWEPGEVHWQIDGQGQLVLGVSNQLGVTQEKGKPSGLAYRGPSYVSPKLLGPDDMQRWVQLATVFDAEARKVRHYFDGELVSEESFQIEHPKVRFGACELGNWSPSTQKHYLTRGFHGRIDEIAVLARVMVDDEIRQHYENGKP